VTRRIVRPSGTSDGRRAVERPSVCDALPLARGVLDVVDDSKRLAGREPLDMGVVLNAGSERGGVRSPPIVSHSQGRACSSSTQPLSRCEKSTSSEVTE
jgi:hypothetical protein